MMFYFYLSLSFFSFILTLFLHFNRTVHFWFFIISGVGQVFSIIFNILRVRYAILDTTLIIGFLLGVLITLFILVLFLFVFPDKFSSQLNAFSTNLHTFHVEWPLRILHETFCRLTWYKKWCILVRKKIVPSFFKNGGSRIFTLYFHVYPYYVIFFMFYVEFMFFQEIYYSLRLLPFVIIVRCVFLLFYWWCYFSIIAHKLAGMKVYPKDCRLDFNDFCRRKDISIEEFCSYFPTNRRFLAQLQYDMLVSHNVLALINQTKLLYHRNSKAVFIMFCVYLFFCFIGFFADIFLWPSSSIYIFFLSLPLAERVHDYTLAYLTPEEEYQQQLANNGYILPKI